MTVGELLARISARELSEWAAFFRLEGPTGDPRGDIQAATIAATVANVNRDPKRRRRPYEVDDFLPTWGDSQPQAQSWQQQQAAVERINRLIGGKDER